MSPTILVPLDGTDSATTALPIAAGIARLVGASLQLLTVETTPPTAHLGRAALIGVGAVARDRHRELEAMLARHAATLQAGGLTARCHVASRVDVARAIIDAAREPDVVCVVMTTHARPAFTRALLGSVADEVARQAPGPVVLVPPHRDGDDVAPDAGAPTTEWSPRRILVPLDGSATAEHVLDILAAVPGLRSTPIVLVSALVPSTLLGIVPPDVMVDDATSDVDLVAMRAELATVAEACVARGLARPAVHVALGAARDVILDALSDHDADLIAMTTRGRSGLARAVLGSTADAIVRVSPVPVLLVTPGDRPA